MTRDEEARLLDFCARQYGAFQEESWLNSPPAARAELAAACLFLGGVDWFGHRQQLVNLGSRLVKEHGMTFSQLVSSISFDCARFSNLLKRRLGHA
jgi:hypothetical protein